METYYLVQNMDLRIIMSSEYRPIMSGPDIPMSKLPVCMFCSEHAWLIYQPKVQQWVTVYAENLFTGPAQPDSVFLLNCSSLFVCNKKNLIYPEKLIASKNVWQTLQK